MTVLKPLAFGGEWDCGHPFVEANVQRIGKAGYRCKQCRRRIVRESMRRKIGFYELHVCGRPPYPNARGIGV